MMGISPSILLIAQIEARTPWFVRIRVGDRRDCKGKPYRFLANIIEGVSLVNWHKLLLVTRYQDTELIAAYLVMIIGAL